MRGLCALALAFLLVACGGHAMSPEPLSPVATSEPTIEVSARIAEVGACFSRGPGDYIESIQREEGERSFRIHAPMGYDGTANLPLVFNFHGQSRTALEQDVYSNLPAVADEHGFFVVSPEGGLAQWNIVGVYAEDGIDDVGAVAEILDRVESEFCIDSQRVFATGMSNGGQMASQVGCFLSDRFAGIAPVAGLEFQDCVGSPMAVITFHGTDDYNVPYDAIPGNVAAWVSYNGCPVMPESDRIGESVLREAYFGCEGQPVVFYTIEGGGHTWPGAEDNAGGVGVTNHEINASELIWEFFKNVRKGE
ncbi:MAG: PHB depolymerase family esterase [Dehalococcoidia bacterium]